MVKIFRKRFTLFRLMLVNMTIRGRFWQRVLLLMVVFGISFFVTVFICENMKIPKVMHLTDLNKCPACYGVSVCPELYSNQILLENHRLETLLFNAKNIYYGYTKSNRKVILKKLAHSSELRDFDLNLCKQWGFKPNCKPIHLLKAVNVNKKIEDLVQYNFSEPNLEPRKGLIYCPYAFGIHDFILPALAGLAASQKTNNYKSDLINVWTMLSINPEPIVIQVIPKTKGWHVPAYGGVCGRLEVVGYEGEPLTGLYNIDWHRKLTVAKNLIDAAMDFTYKHDRYRFYLMDWATDNIVVNEKDEVTVVDLEDMIILDKHISPKSDLPNWYQRDSRDELQATNEFSIINICTHHLSDHNIFSACLILAGDDHPFLSPVPPDFKPWAHLLILFQDCLKGTDRLKAGTLLQQYLTELVMKEKSKAVS